MPAAQGGGGGGFGLFLPLIVMFAIFYFLILRPQKKREQQRKDMIARVQKNDRVVTAGGVHGVVVAVRDADVTLRVDDDKNVRMVFSKSAISRVLTGDDADGEGGSR